jgi:hypothetical protein
LTFDGIARLEGSGSNDSQVGGKLAKQTFVIDRYRGIGNREDRRFPAEFPQVLDEFYRSLHTRSTDWRELVAYEQDAAH